MTGVTITFPGVSAHEYHAMSEKIFGESTGSTLEELPAELFANIAGSANGDLHVFQLWASRRHFEKFWEEHAEPARKRAGIDSEPFISFFAIEDIMYRHDGELSAALESSEDKDDDRDEQANSASEVNSIQVTEASE